MKIIKTIRNRRIYINLTKSKTNEIIRAYGDENHYYDDYDVENLLLDHAQLTIAGEWVLLEKLIKPLLNNDVEGTI